MSVTADKQANPEPNAQELYAPFKRRRFSLVGLFFLLILLEGGCTANPIVSATLPGSSVEEVGTMQTNPTADPKTSMTVQLPAMNPPSVTPRPTSTPSPAPSARPSPSITPTATPLPTCDQREPHGDLLALVTLDYGLSRDFEPADLVLLSDYLPERVTLGYPTQLREIVVVPLSQMIADMLVTGLDPRILSGYRSYSAQAIARSKWLEQYPDRVSIISAPPGHSEHQLGTTVDFGSPELAEIVGEEDIEFHTYFYKTSEGIWLAENAHRYGFTLSYTVETFELTGMYYEPWHFRYVGVELATELFEKGISFNEMMLDAGAIPCIP